MKYMLFVCADPEAPRDQVTPDIDEWLAAVKDVRLDGNELKRPDQARSVRVRDGKTLVTEGPFTETQEWIAGYDILDCDSLEEAIEFAAKHPMAYGGVIEVRPYPAG
jgi:hypothetical protein